MKTAEAVKKALELELESIDRAKRSLGQREAAIRAMSNGGSGGDLELIKGKLERYGDVEICLPEFLDGDDRKALVAAINLNIEAKKASVGFLGFLKKLGK